MPLLRAVLFRLLTSAVVPSSALLSTGCGTAPAGKPAAVAPRAPTEPPTAQAQIVGTDDDPGGTAAEVFERAKQRMAAGEYALARTLFDRVVKADAAERAPLASGASDPSPLGRAAEYNAALCSERLDAYADARDRFRALAMRVPSTSDALDANFRRARLDVELADWTDLGQASAALLARTDLAKFDRAEALGLQALSMVHSPSGGGDLASAEKNVSAAEKLIDKNDPQAVTPAENLAAVRFARGEILRAQGNAIVFIDKTNPTAPIMAADFPAKMETRCQKILDAQDAYVEAINTFDLRWAVRAGLRVATMYVDLHDALLVIPPPKSATTEAKKQLFRGAMMLRYRILLEKGLGTLDRTLNLEKAAGAKSTWLDQAKKAKATLEKQLEAEKEELKKLPYTEAQLQKALDDLSGKPGKS